MGMPGTQGPGQGSTGKGVSRAARRRRRKQLSSEVAGGTAVGAVSVMHLPNGSVVMGDLTELFQDGAGGGGSLEDGGVGAGSGGHVGGGGSCEDAAAAAPSATQSADADRVSEEEARSLLATFTTDGLRRTAQALGGTGQGSREVLLGYCVSRRVGGPLADGG